MSTFRRYVNCDNCTNTGNNYYSNKFQAELCDSCLGLSTRRQRLIKGFKGVEELIIKNKVSVKHYETLKNMLKYYVGTFIISSCLAEEKDKIKLLTDNGFEKISKVNGTILLRWRNSKKNPCTHPPGWY